MEGKLIKTSKDSHHNGHYFLNDSDGFAIGSTDKDWCKRAISKNPLYILSLKNCDAIANGYDLIKLIEENSKYSEEDWGDGFLFAMNLMSDKKFSEEHLKVAADWYYETKGKKSIDEYIQSLQQTEWDVEIEMIGPLVYPANLPKEGEERPDYRPKLDENGYLILKRK